MSQFEKLLERIRNNPKDVRFDDACRVAERMGYASSKSKLGRKKSGTSHKAYSRPGDPVGLNFQDRDGKIPKYQADQLIAALERIAAENEGGDQ